MLFIGLVLLLLASWTSIVEAQLPPTIPAVHSWKLSAHPEFILPRTVRVVIDAEHAQSRKDNGLTLIPPTLSDFANTFVGDLQELFPSTHVKVVIQHLLPSTLPDDGDIILTLLPDAIASNLTLAKGAPTTEGYAMEIRTSSVIISGAGAKGVFWGTRTLLQVLVLTDGTFPSGSIMDQPDWQTRGFMLDVARQWYPVNILAELCTWASWWKMSEFHLHLSDNLFPSGSVPASKIYARLRLRSSQFPGLTPHINETYSREEFEDLQQHCASRGVTIIPEFDTPGHSAVFTQWKPEIALSSDGTMLNLTHPETIPLLQSVWKEFLPWMHTKQVSIGADEYTQLADDYHNFVNAMSEFIKQEADKEIRIWGTAEPSNKTFISKNVTIQHWEFFEDIPLGLIEDGYNVINSDDAFHYIVVKTGSYPSSLNVDRLWNGSNTVTGGIWYPAIFDRANSSNNPSLTEPLLQGSIMAAWNDPGPTASTPLEVFYEIKGGLPIILAANWQAAPRPNHLTREQFDAVFAELEIFAPGQNLNRIIPSDTPLIVEYDLSRTSKDVVKDLSGNGYDGKINSGVITTTLASKGHNYTVVLEMSFPSGPGTLLSGPDNSLIFQETSSGLTLAFNSSNIIYALRNFTIPSSPSTMTVVITGTEKKTSAFVNGVEAGDFTVSLNGQDIPMAFVIPLETIGVKGVTLKRVSVWDGLHDVHDTVFW